ncbi:hypothetical protein MKQ70_07470 [Chitinophaga sedimenti]|uniref:hypothetical protein n=1 Tax=Chitinophaga sedimenti TaxID=2033606 RepID=UPI0020069B92|nr:hypothetical protein [Chitinophaga sedimenti]MCK7554851.1 hypothetical protein [Chitinophaga sedimenti]
MFNKPLFYQPATKIAPAHFHHLRYWKYDLRDAENKKAARCYPNGYFYICMVPSKILRLLLHVHSHAALAAAGTMAAAVVTAAAAERLRLHDHAGAAVVAHNKRVHVFLRGNIFCHGNHLYVNIGGHHRNTGVYDDPCGDHGPARKRRTKHPWQAT